MSDTVRCEFIGGPKDGEHIVIDSAAWQFEVPVFAAPSPFAPLAPSNAPLVTRIERYVRGHRNGKEVLIHEPLSRS